MTASVIATAMILSFIGHKGGTGKSTVAISLAIELLERGRSVLLVDADRQRTVRQWVAIANARGHLLPQTTESDFEHVQTAEISAWARDYEAVLIDCPSRSTDLQRRALAVSDLSLIPSGTSMLDVWTLRNTVEVVSRVRANRPTLQARFLVNRRVLRNHHRSSGAGGPQGPWL